MRDGNAVAVGRLAHELDAVEASFAAAAAATGGITEERYAMAGASICLRFASPLLHELLTPAFAHLTEPGTSHSEPALTVSLWDSASTGAEPPPRPSAPHDHAPGALFHYYEPPLRSAYQPGLETLSILDTESARAWHWVADGLGSRTGTRRLRSARSSSGGWARAATCMSTAPRWGRRPAVSSSSAKGDRESRPWRSRASSRSSCTPAMTTLR